MSSMQEHACTGICAVSMCTQFTQYQQHTNFNIGDMSCQPMAAHGLQCMRCHRMQNTPSVLLRLQVWSLPDLVAARVAVGRFVATPRCCCWDKDSTVVAAAGDDAYVQIVTAKDAKVQLQQVAAPHLQQQHTVCYV